MTPTHDNWANWLCKRFLHVSSNSSNSPLIIHSCGLGNWVCAGKQKVYAFHCVRVGNLKGSHPMWSDNLSHISKTLMRERERERARRGRGGRGDKKNLVWWRWCFLPLGTTWAALFVITTKHLHLIGSEAWRAEYHCIYPVDFVKWMRSKCLNYQGLEKTKPVKTLHMITTTVTASLATCSTVQF
jgi:hypothetical protein